MLTFADHMKAIGQLKYTAHGTCTLVLLKLDIGFPIVSENSVSLSHTPSPKDLQYIIHFMRTWADLQPYHNQFVLLLLF